MSAKEIQALASQDQLPVDKMLIHVNKKLNVQQSNKNNVVDYRLVEPISVKKGDSITLYECFLNVRGQNSQTINITGDIETEIQYNYYVPNDIFQNASLDGSFQSIYNQTRSSQYKQVPDSKIDIYEGIFPTNPGGGVGEAQVYTALQDADRAMPQGAPMIMGAIQNYGSKADKSDENTNEQSVIWRSGNSKINIKAGNYDVDALAELITEQLNGNIINGDEFQNILFQDRGALKADQVNAVNNNEFLFRLQNTSESGKKYGTFSQLTANEPNCGFDGSADGATDDAFYCFWDLQTFNKQKDRCVDFYENGSQNGKYGTEGSYTFFKLDLPTNSSINDLPQGANDGGSEGLPRIVNVFPRYDAPVDQYPDFCLCPRNPTKDNIPEISTPGANITPSAINNSATIDGGMSPASGGGLGGRYVCSVGNSQNVGTQWLIDGENPPQQNASLAFFTLEQPEDEQTTALAALQRTTNGRFIGTKSFALTFNGGKANRFAFSNFHEPYRIPSVSQSLTNPSPIVPQASNVGDPATKMIFGGEHIASNDIFNCRRNDTDGAPDLRRLAYNVEASSGICILGFAWEKVRETDKYKDILSKFNQAVDIQEKRCYHFLLNQMPWDFYFPSERVAREVWSTTLFAQLGFNYEDIGNVSSRQESYFTQASWYHTINKLVIDETIPQYKMPGIISHNESSLALATSLSCLGNVIEVDPRGMGMPNSDADARLTFQTFDTMGSFLNVPQSPPIAPIFHSENYGGSGNIGGGFDVMGGTRDFAALPLSYAVVPVVADPQYIVGSSYPNLANDSNYFIIESDIVQGNYLDAEGSKKTAIGFVSKQESVADTLFSTEGIEFVFKQDKVINSIGIRVVNVDGTDVSNAIINDGSGFIFILQRNSNEIENYLSVAEQLGVEESKAEKK